MASVIHVKCMGCGKSFNVAAKFAGKKGKCPVCGKIITIPNPKEDAEAAYDVNTDIAEDEIKAVAKSIAMGPGGGYQEKKRGFFARLFGKK